ncbi:MAG: 50S ribosomal protein L11 methyltransferase [Bacteroidetes bacterium]|nr:50S ribosomal protein L11 methyltransferase [Bacteroidota bacterium]
MDYWKFTLYTDPETAEILLAYLGESDFEMFEEFDEGMKAYLPTKADAALAEGILTELQHSFPFSWEKSHVAGQNWNAVWESNFTPVVVEQFCAVRAPFHEPVRDVQYELVIQPRMAFGTGHHETTWMCMAALEKLPVSGLNLFDFGCGTGVLAILAAKMGARHVLGVDIETEAYENTLENCTANGVSTVESRCGTLDAVPETQFDGILANINRNVILTSLDALYEKVLPGGWLLCSGILDRDGDLVRKEAEKRGFSQIERWQRGNWLCIHFQK